MAIAFERMEHMLVSRNSDAIIGGLMIRYFVIKEKLENEPNQSWYFKRSSDNNRKKLESLKNEYDAIRKDFNKHSQDHFTNALAEEQTKRNSYAQFGGSAFMRSIFLKKTDSQIHLLNEIIALKSRTDQLEPIDYYYYDFPEEFVRVVEW